MERRFVSWPFWLKSRIWKLRVFNCGLGRRAGDIWFEVTLFLRFAGFVCEAVLSMAVSSWSYFWEEQLDINVDMLN